MADGTKENGINFDKRKKHPIASGDAKRKGKRLAVQFLCVKARITPVFPEKALLFSIQLLDLDRKFPELLSELIRVDDLDHR